MAKEQFVKLVEDFCAVSQMPDFNHILHGGPITVDGIVFSLAYSEETNPYVLFVYCDYGDVPYGREAEAYRELLETNLLLYTGNGPSFTVSPHTGRVVLADHYPLPDLNGRLLHELVSGRAAQAQSWRQRCMDMGEATESLPETLEPRGPDGAAYFKML